ncbi:hypothetical protein HGA07_08340 [Nocardia veterana]|uniref:DUF8020 domain-containing protein n=2 Tax=Nocardia veterana TaxID=132249 RepID=A0A7X6LW10_9NOCA|nr:hypothetical protein [Nocardia veterana]
MVIGAMTVALGTANADPAPAPAPAADAKPGIDYSAKLVDKTVVTKLKNGTFELVERQGATPDQKQQVVDIKDQAGNVALEMPIDFRIAGVPIPVKPVLKESGTVLELTPDRPANVDLTKPVAAAPVAAVQETQPGQQTAIKADKPVLKDVASPIENQRAMSDFGTKFGLATAIGGFIGTAIGAVIGCVVTLPAGCIPGLVTGAGVGGIVGTVVAGGPTLIAAGVELLNTIQAPDGTSQWSDAAMAAASGQQQQANQPK